jgi:hypothetical protein
MTRLPSRAPSARLASPRSAACALVVLSLVALAGCGGGGTSVDVLSAQAFVRGVNHPYFPIERGWTWHYVGEEEGLARYEEVRTLEQPRRIRGVECTAIEELTYVDGALASITTEWFAQDGAGNVWRFGEESFEREGDVLVRTSDSWLAGQGGYAAWLAFPAQPRVGDRFSGLQPDGVEVLEVRALDAVADVPAGVFPGCVEISANPDDVEDEDIILYAEGVGRVAETSTTGWTHLERVSQD